MALSLSAVRDFRKLLAFGQGVGVQVSGADLEVAVARVRPGGVDAAARFTIENYAGRPAAEWGAEYAAHVDVLVWLAVVAGVGYATSALTTSLTAARRFPAQLVVTALTVVVSWLASGLLVPDYGLRGAAWALLAATLVQTACLGVTWMRAARTEVAS